MTAAAYGDFRGQEWQWMTMALINNGEQELAADNNGEGMRPQRETTATRDSNKRRQRQRIGDDDCGSLWRLPRIAMATDDNGVDQQWHARAGGRRQWGRNETVWQTKMVFGIY